ncbi:MAG TPA: hypothetical protein PKH54_02900 [Myxococcota bacterium]|mgnify:CR=1 FL=1|nr:hypothetical protein [Myxococcota bacterium]HOC98864.1 hypothetical protein [Myxococcota bacterium]HOH75764.1 hypothetical protein [Myxococcota bacterium]HPV03290.1 hypothetical protein [Myxococcota bacterium]
MKKSIVVVVTAFISLAIAGCGRNPCRNLATEVCERAPKTVACEAAGKLTADDECNDYLKNLDKFIELKNTTVTEEGVKPPAPEAPAAEAAPVETADGAAAPTATEGAQPAPAAAEEAPAEAAPAPAAPAEAR